MILEAFLITWLDTYIKPKRARNTLESYRFALAHLSAEILAEDLRQLQPLELQREINKLAADYSRQAQILFGVLRQSLRRAVRLHLIEHSPMDAVDPPPHERREAATFTQEEAAAYLAAAHQVEHGRLLVLMLCLGLRRNEARGLRPDDLDGSGILHVRHQRTRDGLSTLKTRSSRRDIPIPAALRSFFRGPVGEYIDDVSENGLRRAHLAAMRAAGITSSVTLHGLRHTCATLAIENGTQPTTVQRLLGHRHFSTTADFYVHPDRRLLTVCTAVLYNQIARHGARLEIV